LEAGEYNKAMLQAKQEAELSLKEAQKARHEAELARIESEKSRQESDNAKNSAINNLELLQKKTQFEMIGNIVKVALWVIVGVGVTVTLVYLISMMLSLKTDVIGSAWVNVMSILLTNAFSIVGTLMGMKTMEKETEKK